MNANSVKVKYYMADKKWHANMDDTKGEPKAAPKFKYEDEWIVILGNSGPVSSSRQVPASERF